MVFFFRRRLYVFRISELCRIGIRVCREGRHAKNFAGPAAKKLYLPEMRYAGAVSSAVDRAYRPNAVVYGRMGHLARYYLHTHAGKRRVSQNEKRNSRVCVSNPLTLGLFGNALESTDRCTTLCVLIKMYSKIYKKKKK